MFGYALGCRPISAHFCIAIDTKCWRSRGLARVA
jgi:hypothetical protein